MKQIIINKLANLDRRWVFLSMLLAVAIPILLGLEFPETPTQQAINVFDEVERLKEGDRVLLALDYDPSSEGELSPMATSFVLHCAKKKVKMYFLTLYPGGPPMIQQAIQRVILTDFPNLVYGEDYVDLGYKPGYEGVVKVIITNLRELYTTDARGTNIDQIPMCQGVESIQDMDLLIAVSAGYPGCKEWVQYAKTPFPDKINLVAGVTGVQAPYLYPYVPKQLIGLLGAIKGAAEYETLVVGKYIEGEPKAVYQEGRRRMGPQLVAHLLMVFLIIAGNTLYFLQSSHKKS
ncbi:hypothetical protein [Rubinisphaera sp.]|uniref:hypothetical protein n=1 Tax=Rubinisphaera sp. TaxID=2024857 RepID=UPI000C10AE68|nr:hypothetical protein [Rubinisphaera sp.]MBV11470.1 hypothetical protein [Rubinisphaera sp.]HCS51369.1 hypothetical protein [Planctomycetaceae bacterium]